MNKTQLIEYILNDIRVRLNRNLHLEGQLSEAGERAIVATVQREYMNHPHDALCQVWANELSFASKAHISEPT